MSEKESSRVLVIDDDDLVLVIIRKMLEAEMFSVDVSVSAREALDRLPKTRYDAIFCDMWMPGMTGKDFYEQLKKEFPEYQSRIIFLTGDVTSEATWDFIEQERLPYVLKPFSPPELHRKLREVIGEGRKAEPEKGREHRRHRRLAMKANLRVRKKGWTAGGPEITAVGNASIEGVFFVTDQNYSVGTEVLLSFPYSRPGDIEQEGCVVRVDERADGRRGVAIALGEAAAAARALDVSSEERQRQRVVALADMTAEAPPRPSVVEQTAEVSDLKLLDREREEARRLTDELADLKVSYAHAARERDRLASEESDRNLQLRELTSARDEMSRLAEELKQQVQELQEKLAAAERELAQQAELAGRAQQETARAADLKTELDQAQKEVGTLKGLQARIQEFQQGWRRAADQPGGSLRPVRHEQVAGCRRKKDGKRNQPAGWPVAQSLLQAHPEILARRRPCLICSRSVLFRKRLFLHPPRYAGRKLQHRNQTSLLGSRRIARSISSAV